MAIGGKRALKVFLCHASGDKPQVRVLYKHLVAEGVDAWLDQEKLLPGQDWRVEIPRAVQEADVVVICLSNKSITKEGYIQKEIKFALDSADEKPDGTIFLIPARIEDCPVPEKLSRWHWVDLFEEDGYVKLLRSLKLRADKVGAVITPSAYEDEDAETERRLDQYYTEGLAAFYTEDWDKACRRFQSILSERPNHKNAIEKLEEAEKRRDLSKLYTQSMGAYQAEDWQTAIKTLDELLKKSPEYKDSTQLLKNAKKQKQLNDLYIEAKKLHAAGKWQAVLKVFDQVFAIEPNHPDPDRLLPSAREEVVKLDRLAELNDLYSRAVREMDLGNWHETRKLLEQVHKAQTGFLETERLLRKVEDELLKIEEANKRNDQINTLYEQAHGLIRSKNWRKALDKVEEIRKLDSQFEDKDGIAEKAKAFLEREDLEAQKQNQVAAMYTDAVRLVKEGKHLEALEKWNQVRTIDPKYPDRQHVENSVRRKLGEKNIVLKEYFGKNRVVWSRLTIVIAVVIVITVAAFLLNNYTYYDRFEGNKFDGKINTSRWNPVASPPSYVKQQDGVLVLSVGSTRAIASAFAIQKLKADQYNYVESKVLLSSNRTGKDGDTGLAMMIKDKNGQDLIFLCVISRFPPIQTWCEVYGRTEGAEYSSNKKTTNYDVWHTFRIEIDPEINAVFYIDGLNVGTYRPSDVEDLGSNDFTVRLEAWSPAENSIEAHFNDVKIGQYK
ncbi:MAG: TIR domain-containing protein [Anaerolineales bacterium]|nr:TIR domain-containing protein [Anaerolineales bacterium]